MHTGSTSCSGSGGVTVSAMRSRPGSRAAAAANGSDGGGRPGRVPGLVAGEHVEQRRGLGHRARQHPVDAEQRVAEVRARRDAPARGLETDEAAARRRDADRAAAVVAVGERDHARGDRRRRAARGAARGALEVPGVARGPEARGLGHRQDAELGQLRRPDDDHARLAQPADEEGVVARDVIAEQLGADGQPQAVDRACCS